MAKHPMLNTVTVDEEKPKTKGKAKRRVVIEEADNGGFVVTHDSMGMEPTGAPSKHVMADSKSLGEHLGEHFGFHRGASHAKKDEKAEK